MQSLINLVNENLDKFMEITYPEDIFKSMRYTVLLPGKRLRPVMCLEACRMFGGNLEDAIPAACAIEMLHAQTLIHDDLPCMDNDDYRRGKLTNHKVFGEAVAVLAGDALLTFAPQVIVKNSKHLGAEKLLKILEEYFKYAGAYGVIAGQVADIESEKTTPENPEKTLEYIHIHKTSDSTFEQMGKTLGKDKLSGKLTYVSLYGLDRAKADLAQILDDCEKILAENGLKSDIFEQIIAKIRIA